eukprot:TRINITY_DN2567_c0_g1_i1.p2 TRINITY_DN2567_c0_g1~~TRINITY_DN2567_c0_g1_i1.p2  ORF type:complete len:438 (-),score=132.61 TRINITY_DN2567_c0_g1_i1:1855-3168(-)
MREMLRRCCCCLCLCFWLLVALDGVAADAGADDPQTPQRQATAPAPAPGGWRVGLALLLDVCVALAAVLVALWWCPPASHAGSNAGAAAATVAHNAFLSDPDFIRDTLHDDARWAVPECPLYKSAFNEAVLTRVEEVGVGTWGFNPMLLKEPITATGLFVMTSRNLLSALAVTEESLTAFLRLCDANYQRRNAYHNAYHAADVLHSCHLLLSEGGADKFLQPLEVFSLLIAAAIHDLGHPGLSAAWAAKVRHPVDRLFSGWSPLEHFSCFGGQRFAESSGLLAKLNPADTKLVRSLVVESVLSTDIARHAEEVALSQFVIHSTGNPGEPGFCSTPAARRHVLRLTLKAADLAGNVRSDFLLLREWSGRITHELNCATLVEKGTMPHQNPQEMAKAQHAFLANFVQPLLAAYNALFPITPVMNQLQANLTFWQQQAQK